MTQNDDGSRVAAAMREIFEALPGRLNIRTILIDAHARLVAAAGQVPGVVENAAAQTIVAEKVAEVMREIATIAVQEFVKRTGQPFEWHDDPEPEPDDDMFMSFALDAKGNVVFGGEAAEPPPPTHALRHESYPTNHAHVYSCTCGVVFYSDNPDSEFAVHAAAQP